MNTLPKSILFITGAFLSHHCWNEWIHYFESKGYHCIAPPWPHKEATAEELRNRPANDPIASNTLNSLLAHYANIISALPEKPILIGHSLGGLIVQLLLQQKLAAAAVAIHSFPPKGINRFWLSFLKAVWEAMVILSSSKETYLISFNKWRYTVANGLEYEEQKELYYQYATPESKKVIREAFNCTASIDFTSLHAPLLITSGSNDKLISASLNYSNYRRYGNGHSITEYIEFKAHSHLVFGVSFWKEEADSILHWLQGLDKK